MKEFCPQTRWRPKTKKRQKRSSPQFDTIFSRALRIIGAKSRYVYSSRRLPEVESRTQGSRPRTQKESEAKDSPTEDRFSRGQGPRTKDTSTSVLQKKRSSQKFFRRSPEKNVFQKFFQALYKLLTVQKIVLSSSRGQGNFRGLEASRPSTSKCVLEDVVEAKDVLEDSTSDAYS